MFPRIPVIGKWLGRHRSADAELDSELRAYVELLTEEKVRSGMNPAEARRAALVETGGVEQVKEECRDVRRFAWFEDLRKDVQYALRASRANPGFAAVVILILALGIGANLASFSLLNAVAFKSLLVRAPDELVWFADPGFSYPIFQETRDRGSDVFSSAFAWTIENAGVDWNQNLQQAPVMFATEDYFATLGIAAVDGRVLMADDADSNVAVISHHAWQRRFRGAPGIAGTTVHIDRVPFTIVGVAPEGFYGVAPGLAPELTVPVKALARLRPEEEMLKNPHRAWLHIMARLKPGVSREQANAALEVFWPQIMDALTPRSMPAARRARFLERKTELMPGHAGFSRVGRQYRQPLLVLLGLAGLLLLATCATMTNLLLVRAASRRRELAVRLAIGATRGRLFRQLLVEAGLVSAVGVVAAVLFVNWGSSLLAGLMATSNLPIQVDLSLDVRVVGLTLALWLLTVLIAVVGPALRATHVDPAEGLKESPRTVGDGPAGSRIGRLLVVSQVALAVLMVSGSALFLRSLGQLLMLDPGFEHRNVLLVRFEPLLAGYRDGRLASFYTGVQERLRGIPGVEQVSLSWVPPVSSDMGAWTQRIGVDGPAPETRGQNETFMNVVSPNYFVTIGQRLLAGRDFGPEDNAAGPGVCIVTESLVRTYLPGQDPLGHYISIGHNEARKDLRIIGVVQDAKYRRLQEPASRTAYFPVAQSAEFLNSSNLMAEVRAAGSPELLIEPLRRELMTLDASVPVRFETLSHRVHESLVIERVVAVVSAFLGSVALLLAAAGLYGLLAYTVSRRTREIGVRVALGAKRTEVEWMVLRGSLVLSVAGVAAGLMAAFALGRFAEKLLYGVTARDPLALGATCALVLLLAGVAAWLPARRAARVDPTVALRCE